MIEKKVWKCDAREKENYVGHAPEKELKPDAVGGSYRGGGQRGREKERIFRKMRKRKSWKNRTENRVFRNGVRLKILFSFHVFSTPVNVGNL